MDPGVSGGFVRYIQIAYIHTYILSYCDVLECGWIAVDPHDKLAKSIDANYPKEDIEEAKAVGQYSIYRYYV